MNADEDGTYRAWRLAREGVVDPAIAAHGGRIVKHTGDGFLAEFGTVLAAVQCAIAIQTQMAARNDADADEQRRLQFRIGVNLGDIIVDDEDIHGDGVNIAARLESLAEPGGVCVSADVYNQVRMRVPLQFEDLGECRVKNIPEPVRAYGVVPAGAASRNAARAPHAARRVDHDTAGASTEPVVDPAAFDVLLAAVSRRDAPANTAVVGRDKELALLLAALDEARGDAGSIVMIRGDPGIGKSRLAQAFAEHARAAGARVVSGHCHETLGSPPFWPWLQILRELATQHAGENAAATDIVRGLMTGGTAERSGTLSLFTQRGASEQFMLFSRITSHLSALAAECPLVLVLDDLHWADRSSLALLAHLCERVASLPILVLGTYREHEVTRRHPLFSTLADAARRTTLHRIHLDGLTRDEVLRFIGEFSAEPLPGTVLEAIFAKTEGNPLFVTEVMRILEHERSRAVSERFVVEIPDGIRDAIGRRLDQLSGECTDLLGVAAVIGRRFGLAELASIVRASNPLDVLQILDEAVRSRVVETEGADRFRFCHVLVRDLLYEELSLVRRITLHKDVGDALAEQHARGVDRSPGEIARHYYHAVQAGQGDKALEFALEAAEQASSYAAHHEAIEFYDLALDVLGAGGAHGDGLEARIHLGRAKAMNQAGAPVPDCRACLDQSLQAARATRSYDVFAEAAASLAFADRYFDPQHSLSVVEEALSYLPPDDLARRARLLGHLANALMFNHRRREAETVAAQAIDTANECADPMAKCHCLLMVFHVLRGRPEKLSERIRLSEQLLEIARDEDDPFLINGALMWRVLSYMEAGEMRRAAADLAQLDALPESHHNHHGRYHSAWARGCLALFHGRFESAKRLIDIAAEFGAGTLDGGSEGVYGAQMFLLNRELGRLPMVRGAMQQLVADPAARMWQPALLATLVELEMLDDARTLLAELTHADLHAVLRDELYPVSLAYLSEACAALEDAATARVLYPKLVPYSGQMILHPTATCYGPADLYLGMLASAANDLADAQRLLGRARELCARNDPSMWTVHVDYRHAQVLQRHNHPQGMQAFRDTVQQARSAARALGMVNLLAKLDRLEAGAQTARNTKNSLLTPREVEVLALLAQGKSNKMIAAELNRSLATVATHVRSILGKTHTANRTEAAAYARDNALCAPGDKSVQIS
jgi:ATP/maltotriose-dependent transcriptional regulator MalT